MKILCICEHGNVRSVALRYLLETIYGYDALAMGMKDNSEETKQLLYQWADKIIFLDSRLMINLPVSINQKIHLIDVGSDVWHNSQAQELHHKILKQLKKLDFL